MATCDNCGLVVLPQEIAMLIVLPDEPFCCCHEPDPVIPGIFYDGTALYDGTAIYDSTLA